MATPILGHFHTSEGAELAIAVPGGEDGTYKTVAVLAETDVDGMTGGTLAFKHNVSPGGELGHFSAA